MGYTVAPPHVSDDDVAKGAETALKDGTWKKEGDQYKEKGGSVAVSKKDFHKAVKAQLEVDAVKKRKKKIKKEAEALLSSGAWKSAEGKNGKSYYYNKNDKSEVIWDLEEHVGKELGYVSKKDKKEKKEKEEKKEKKDKDEKKEKEEKKEKKDKEDKKEKEEKKEKKDKEEKKEKKDKEDKKEKEEKKEKKDKDEKKEKKEKEEKKDKEKEKDKDKDKKSKKSSEKKTRKGSSGKGKNSPKASERESSMATSATQDTAATTAANTTTTSSSPHRDSNSSEASPAGVTDGDPQSPDATEATPMTPTTTQADTAITPPTVADDGDEDDDDASHHVPTESLLDLLPAKPVMKRPAGEPPVDQAELERQRQAQREAAAKEAAQRDEEEQRLLREQQARLEEERLLKKREDEERAAELLLLQEQQRELMRQERDALLASEASVRVAIVEHSQDIARLEIDESRKRYLLQLLSAQDLDDAQAGLAESAFRALQQQMRNEVAREAVLAFTQLEEYEIVSRTHYCRLQLERELSERMILAEIELEDRLRYQEEEELCRDAVLIVERRHHMWLHEARQLVEAWVGYTRSKFGEFYLEGVEELQRLKAVERQYHQALLDAKERLRDVETCETMGRREMDAQWERERTDSARDFEQRLLQCAEEERRVMALPKASTEKQLSLIKQQIEQMKSGRGSPERLHNLQSTSRQCEIARISARINALEDDSQRHRAALASMRQKSTSVLPPPAAEVPGSVEAANARLNSIRLQIESIQTLQTHQAITVPKPAPTQARDTYHHLLHAFYTRHDVSKIATIPSILDQFAGREDALFSALSRKYSLGTPNPYRESLRSILSRGAPWQLPCVDVILHLYQGAEYDLIDHLMHTYQ